VLRWKSTLKAERQKGSAWVEQRLILIVALAPVPHTLILVNQETIELCLTRSALTLQYHIVSTVISGPAGLAGHMNVPLP